MIDGAIDMEKSMTLDVQSEVRGELSQYAVRCSTVGRYFHFRCTGGPCSFAGAAALHFLQGNHGPCKGKPQPIRIRVRA